MEWKTFGNIYFPPVVDKPSAANEQLYTEGKKHYGRKAKLEISPFVSFAGKSIVEVYNHMEYCNKLGLLENRHLISMDISVEKYDNHKIHGNVLSFYGDIIVVEDNYVSSPDAPDYTKLSTDEQYRVTNWHYTETVWCSGSSPLHPTKYNIDVALIFYELMDNEIKHKEDFDITRIRVTLNKIIEK